MFTRATSLLLFSHTRRLVNVNTAFTFRAMLFSLVVAVVDGSLRLFFLAWVRTGFWNIGGPSSFSRLT